jgi:hypothetical protein
MAEANAAFLRGRAADYRRKANAAPDSPAAAEFLRLAELWDAEAAAADAELASQPAPSILRKPVTTGPAPSILRKPPSEPARHSA